MQIHFREDLLMPLHMVPEYENLDKGPLYLEYQRLNDVGDKIEANEGYSEDTQKILEMIGEKQTEILNQISIN